MRKILFLMIFVLLQCGAAFAADHWVYIRLEDRPGVSDEEDAQRSKRGDVVAIIPATEQFVPTEKEKQEYLILKVSGLTETDIRKYLEPIKNLDENIAYRKYKIDLKELGITVKKGLQDIKVNKNLFDKSVKEKTSDDLVRYKINRIRYAYLSRPIERVARAIVPNAYAENISTINKTGETYNTCALWEDAVDGDLDGDNRQETGEFYNDDGVLTESAGCTIDGSTTSATDYMKITVPAGERHNGTFYGGGFKIQRTDFSGAGTITINDNYTVVEWVTATFDYFSSTVTGIIAVSSDGDNSTVRYTVLANCNNTVAANSCDGFFVSSGVTGLNVYDNIVHDNERQGFYSFQSAVNFYNNTSYSNDSAGFRSDTSTSVCTNCLSIGNAGGDYVNSWTLTTSGASDTTGTLDNLVAGDTFVTTTGGSEDLHQKSGALTINAGTDLGTSPSGVEIDIDNRNRDTNNDTWDIGADELVGGAAPRRMFILM